MEHEFKTQAVCQACKATGVYTGMAERDGSSVVCHACKGTGEVTLTLQWDHFKGKQKHPDVTHVVEANPGICMGEGEDRRLALSDFGGMPYEDWFSGEPFPDRSEMRGFTCPAWWYQSADYKRRPDWEDCIGIGSFSECMQFPNKDACWKRFDREEAESA